MIAMYFLRLWVRVLLGTVTALTVELLVLHLSMWFAPAVVVTVAAFGLVTRMMWLDWKSARNSGAGYRYETFKDVTRDRR